MSRNVLVQMLMYVVICTSTHATADEIEVRAVAGTGSISGVTKDLGANGWEISFQATVSGSGEFRVHVEKTTATSANIRSIEINSRKGSGSDATSFVAVHVLPFSATERLGVVHSVTKHANSDADLKLSILNVGQVGSNSTTDPGQIEVNQVQSFDLLSNPNFENYTGTLYADLDISAGSLATGAVDNIFLKGSLLGDIIADGFIANVLADGIIGSDAFPVTVHGGGGLGTLNATQGPMGTDSTPVTITTGNNTGIELVTADSMHANITTTGSGDLRRITVRKGDFRGNVDVHELDIVGDPNIPPEIRIRPASTASSAAT